jgi:hypothetical protein
MDREVGDMIFDESSLTEEDEDEEELEMAIAVILHLEIRRPRLGSYFGSLYINRDRKGDTPSL